ncbi:MAG: DUF2513 domain-containing protein [Candidatus Acidiferrales bacterium]
MTRDMDLIREVLLEVEKSPPLKGCKVEIPGRSQEELCEHARLAQEAGFIKAKFLPGSADFYVLRLTYEGHEFLDAARNDTLWTKAKEIAIEKTGTLTLEGLKIALASLIKHMLGGGR